jgi:hypothetical protein
MNKPKSRSSIASAAAGGIMERGFSAVFAYLLFLCAGLIVFAREASQAVIPFSGLDPVALIDGKEVRGKEEFSVIRGNFKYLFAGIRL